MEYAEIFTHRGDAYHRAMQRFAGARDAEFRELFRRRPVKPGETVLDVPSGGGYLANTLDDDACVTALEFTAGFSPDVRVVETYGQWDVGEFDHAVCLAGLHHIEDQDRFVSQLVRHTRPGGTVHIADVDHSQPLARYLDNFVGRYNSTGHKGKYLTAKSFIRLPHTRLIGSEIRDCPWAFDSEESLLTFCGDLFGLSNYPRDELRAQLEHHAGITRVGGAAVLGWRLRYIDLEVVRD
jgi:SAM-dependent methyltransferase